MDQDVTIKELSNVDETSSTQEIIPPTRTEEQHKEVSPDTSLEPPSDDQEKQTTSSINPLDSKPLEQQQYINSPSSWQIPPSAFQQKQQQQQQPYEPTESLKSLEKTTSKRDRLEQRIKEDEEDLDAWFTLIADIQQSGDLEATRAIYERFLKIYPTSTKHWLAYLELELKYSNFSQVEALFTRCLKTVLSVDLWKFYLGYIRRINSGEGGGLVTTPESRAVIEKAYEYVLSNVGIDKDAGPIWADYIYFLKSAETTNTWEEQRKMDSMRRVYQKAVAIPLNNVEHLWKEYDQWENNLNRLTAKKFLGEKSSAYMTARTALRESRPFTDNLIFNTIPRKPRWTNKEAEQLNLWKRYIKWEKGNPLHLEEKNAVIERVSYVYQQAFLVLRFYPELWYDYAMYYWELSKPDKTLALLKQGMEILPTSLLLHFAYAEICESRKMLDEARKSFDSLLERLDQDIEKLKSTAQQDIQVLQQEADEEKANMNLGDDVDGELREQLRTKERQVKKEQDKLEEQLSENMDVIMRQCSLVWIAYMRFARRTEGIKAARALFSRARKSQNRTYHVFIASALMEYHNSKDAGIAGKIFGLGIKSFADDPAYICEYLDFLIQMNDDNNTRALFERSLASLPSEKATDVWRKFMEYENRYGDLTSVQNVEKRLREANPEVTQLDSFLARYSYLDLHPVSELEVLEEPSSGTPAASPSDIDTNQVDDEYDQQQQQQSYKEKQTLGRTGEPKRALLESVHAERYPRPDWSQWQLFKPTAESSRPPISNLSAPLGTVDELKRSALNPSSPPPPFAATTTPPQIGHEGGSAPTVSTQPIIPAPIQQQQQLHTNQPPEPSPPSSNLPDLITYFVTNLPSPADYNGPILNAMEFVELLRNVNLPSSPMPRGSAVPIGMSRLPSSSSATSSPSPGRGHPGIKHNLGRDMPPGRGRGRGGSGMGFKRGGSGGPIRGRGMKRKGGRDDYEDDYQGNKGMGPNRPPDYDVFRARQQAKRQRDDSPF